MTTVKELIDFLETIEDKTLPVIVEYRSRAEHVDNPAVCSATVQYFWSLGKLDEYYEKAVVL